MALSFPRCSSSPAMVHVSSGSLGKQVAGSVYVHLDALTDLSPSSAELVWAAQAFAGATAWNVIKLQEDGRERVSFLTYEDFDEPFPALLESLSVDLSRRSAVRRSYRGRPNPPVLHRKELLLPAEDPRREAYGRLTTELERLGLLERGSTIGTKLGWERRLREAGVMVVGHEIRPANDEQRSVRIRRHLAALRRDGLSTPVQALLRHGLIADGVSVFDYGCGWGSDVEGLQAAGIGASGWDPHFAPDAPKSKADVVNLGFVLNVIEKPLERVEALRSAFALARKCLAVAVITSSSARLENCRPYGDGYVTRIGTFQKFFQPSELKGFIEGVLDREALAAGPGLFFVFRDPDSEQEFLLSRQTRRAASPVLLAARRSLARQAKVEAIRPELEALAELSYALGRAPAAEEAPTHIVARLAGAKVSIASALRLAEALCDPEALAQAHAQRSEDLSVYFALNLFNGRARFKNLPPRLQRDVKVFFSDLGAAEAAGRALLFSAGETEQVACAAQAAVEAGLGCLDEEGGYWVAADLAPRLPATLRCYAGCAERFAGGLDTANVLKFHLQTGKLTALNYADFDRTFLPRLETRTKIDLRARRVRVFDHRSEDQRLLLKSRLMAPDQPGFGRQAEFDRRAAAAGLGELGLRAAWPEIVAKLQASGRLGPSPRPATPPQAEPR